MGPNGTRNSQRTGRFAARVCELRRFPARSYLGGGLDGREKGDKSPSVKSKRRFVLGSYVDCSLCRCHSNLTQIEAGRTECNP